MPILLSTEERRVLNNLTRVQNKDVSLGNILGSMLDRIGDSGTPVNAVAAKATLTFSGAVKHGQKVTVHNPTVAAADVYEFLADEAQAKSVPTNIAVDISDKTTAASVTLTMDTQPVSGDTVTIAGKVYTFVPVGTDTADGEVSVGADLAAAQAALVAAVNGEDEINTPNPLVFIGDFDVADQALITAFIGGTAGNDIEVTETFAAASNLFSGAKLSLGGDCPAADAITALALAITGHDSQGVSGTDGEGDTLVISADVPGIAGNNILVSEDLTGATFGAGVTKLSGGVDGTVTDDIKILVDNTYVYICLGANSISGQKWRRVTLSSF